ncbi:MAG: helix-turn-helix domain-containing protein [Candidatus Aminicenantes bacterium]|nr:helix-turn-helix domain-containing protein [Candidatus Aminicenantes bacterium]
MRKEEFARIRKLIGKTQKEISLLLGVSTKTVESYEQGFRKIPANVERIIYYLFFKLNINKFMETKSCWDRKECSPGIREHCIAWLAQEGFFCWFLTGKTCACERLLSGGEAENCFSCSFFRENLEKIK